MLFLFKCTWQELLAVSLSFICMFNTVDPALPCLLLIAEEMGMGRDNMLASTFDFSHKALLSASC